MGKLNSILVIALYSICWSTVSYEYIDATLSDFSAGDTVMVEFLTPDPDGLDDCALTLSRDDTIRVLQVYPDGHCRDCIADVINTYMLDGRPPLNIKIELIRLSSFNGLSSPSDSATVRDPFTGTPVGSRCMLDYHIIMFGIANGFGGRLNDLSDAAKSALISYARTGNGVVLTHDTIAKRHGFLSDPGTLCSDLYDFIHENFNTLTDITGLDDEWVTCAEPDNIYNYVWRDSGADPTASVLHYPFELPDSFPVTDCHSFGEHYFAGNVWYRGPEGQIYMHTFHDPEYDAFGGYFSTGHQEEYDGTSFRPLEWEAKAMINTMFYSFYGGRGNGIYTSAVIDAGCPASLDSVHLEADLPGSSFVIIELRTSPDGISWSDWYEVISGSPLPPEISASRYFQYRLSLSLGTPADDPPIVHWFGLFGTQNAPEAELLSPHLNATTACSCGVVQFLITSEYPLNLEECRVVFDGTTYSAPYLSTLGDTLTFTPPDCFSHGEHHDGTLHILEDIEGCSSELDLPFEFYVDLHPPVYSTLVYLPGDTIGLSSALTFLIVDDGIGLDEESIDISIDGVHFSTSVAGIDFNSDTLIIYLATLDIELGGYVDICLGASDSVSNLLCGPNSSDTCWTFFVDTVPPIVSYISPHLTACDSLLAVFIISDPAGIDTAGILDTTGITISLNGDIYYYPDGMIFRNDTLYFSPSIPLLDGDTLQIQVYSVSDIFGNNTSSPIYEIIVDRSPPTLTSVPADGDTVNNPWPMLSLCLQDIISGLDTYSVSLVLNSDTFFVGDGLELDTCFVWDASAVGLTFSDGDTLQFCLNASDLISEDFCGPNILDTCFNLYITLPGPIADIIYPDNSIFSSCSLQSIFAQIHSGDALIAESLFVVFCDETLGISDPRLALIGDSLIFTPMVPYSDGDTVYFEILRAVDEIGGNSDHLDSVWFIIDLSPPILYISINNGDTIYDPLTTIYFSAHDSGCGVSSCSLMIDEQIYNIDNCDSFYFDPDEYGICFNEEQYHTINFLASDCAQYCENNTSESEVQFYIPDDDTIPPNAILLEPVVFLADSSFPVIIYIVDTSGIYLPADPADSQDAYIIWDSDGELIVDFYRAELYIDSVNGDTSFLHSDLLPEQTAGTNIIWRAYFWDNDFDCSQSSDRIPDSTDTQTITIIAPPHLEMIHPPDGAFTSCTDIMIYIVIESEDPIDLSSLLFTVMTDTLSVTSPRINIVSDTIIISPPVGNYDEGEITVRLLYGQTTLGYQLAEQQWHFSVDLTPPEIEFTEPTDGEMLPEPDFIATVISSDNLSGVDTSSAIAYFILNAETLWATTSAEEYMDGWRIQIPSPAEISPADSVSLTLQLCDDVDICPQNCTQHSVQFWIEPNFPCSLSTNPITPNGDGFNDEVIFFYPKPLSNSVVLYIYDLAGKRIISRDIPPGSIRDMKWDGTRNGKKIPAGTYLYVIEKNGKVLCRGSITIAR